MLQVRNSLFETNSSSTHSITIANNYEDEFKEYLPESLEFEVGEYGWEFERYDDLQSRSNYLYTAILTCGCDAEVCLKKLRETLESYGIEVYFTEVGLGEWFYIDHSYEMGDFVDTILNDETLLMNYLFSPESFIATGNDNCNEELNVDTCAKNILMEYYKGN